MWQHNLLGFTIAQSAAMYRQGMPVKSPSSSRSISSSMGGPGETIKLRL